MTTVVILWSRGYARSSPGSQDPTRANLFNDEGGDGDTTLSGPVAVSPMVTEPDGLEILVELPNEPYHCPNRIDPASISATFPDTQVG